MRWSPTSARFADPTIEADTIFFGGGTPSLLEPGGARPDHRGLPRRFALSPDAEITIEANPESSTGGDARRFRAAGANRLSFGVQSFRDEELRRLGPAAFVPDRARRGAAGAGGRLRQPQPRPDDVAAGQSTAEWLASVDALIDQQPDHASLYLLEIYPNAPLRDEMARGRLVGGARRRCGGDVSGGAGAARSRRVRAV